MFSFRNVFFFSLLSLLLPVNIMGQVFPAGFSQEVVASNVVNPTVMAFAPDGRIFICEQAGKIHIVKDNALLATPFLQLSVNSTGERGLIGIAFDPEFTTNQFIYLYYTVPTAPIHNRISRFTANGDAVLAGSEQIILELDNLSGATNHNGGAMHFGIDGKLYVAIGENANGAHAQNLDTYHGKLLRINKDGSTPDGNPFSGSEQKNRVWSYGLRNPYTFSIQSVTGRIFVNDVGQNTWEEINDATQPGINFGWPGAEGVSTNPAFVNPVYTYQHGAGDGRGCAITGGTFFNPSVTNYPGQYYDKYFYQDLCNNWINYIDYSTGSGIRSPFATSLPGGSLSLMVGNEGNLYYLSRSNRALYKIIYSNATAPFITNQPDDVTTAEGDVAQFSVSAIGTTPLQYQWQKNGQDIDGATNATLTLDDVQPSDEGIYSVTVTNSAGSELSEEVNLTIVDVNDLPTATILTPTEGSLYTAGTSINFSGNANDEEDGDLPASSFSWEINFYHNELVQEQLAITGIKEGSFDVPDEGETSANVWYRFILTVTDSEGLTAKDSVDVHPRKSTITLVTDPAELQLTLDGQPIETPASIVSVEGLKRTIGVVSPQNVGDESYQFNNWEHGGDATQIIVTPEDDITYTASFSVVLDAEEDFQDNDVSVFPNPASSKNKAINLKVFSSKKQSSDIYLVDMLGREISSVTKVIEPGENNFLIGVEALTSGVYGIMMEVESQKVFKRIIISN